MLTVLAASQAWSADDSESDREYKIKSGFIYNFIKYIDWPEKKLSTEKDGDDPIVIGVIGVNPFGGDLEPITKKKIKDKELVIKQFPGFKQTGGKYNDRDIENLRNCHVLFVSSSEKKYIEKIIKLVSDSNVLTVSDTDGFVETGGIINFVTEKKKVRFSINLDAAKRSKLVIPTAILKIAQKVIHEQKSGLVIPTTVLKIAQKVIHEQKKVKG